MKRLERGGLLFLVLVLALSTSVSYLGIRQVSHADRQDDVQRMTVALVNEDEGATLNETPYDFGQEFVKRIEKDDTHDWYVVSRGVAESGLARNVYDMMIIIPHDFSERALSIDSEAPERVPLLYKINASENEDVRAEAEKTAMTILNDFNRRIIDVYFASVIGNLQEAQDKISAIVEKEVHYTHTYKHTVHAPLSNYTDQFKTVQDYTQLSIDSFQGLQDLLNVFEESLADGAETNQTFLADFDDLAHMKEANTGLLMDFSDQLRHLDSQMNDGDVMRQLDNLEQANKAIHAQFQQPEEEGVENILSRSAFIRKKLKDTKDQVGEMNEYLEAMGDETEEHVERILRDAFESEEDEENVTLKELLGEPDKRVHDSIQEQIAQLPSLNVDEFEDLGFSGETITQLINIVEVTEKYKREFEYDPGLSDSTIPLADLVQQIKNRLHEQGVTVTDSITIPETKERGQVFTLSIPEEFKVERVNLKLPGKEEYKDYTRFYKRFNKIYLPATDEGEFRVRLVLKLKDEDAPIDVFQPVTWHWKLRQRNIDIEILDPLPDPDPGEEPPGSDEDDADEEQIDVEDPSNGAKDEDGDGNENKNSENGNDSNNGDGPTDEGEEPDDDNGSGNGEEGSNDNGGTNEEDEDSETPVTRLIVTKNFISHKVMSPLTYDSTGKLINRAADTVSPYQRLLKLYEGYFGLPMDDEKLADKLRRGTLRDIAGDKVNSLYYLFNVEDILDLLETYVVGHITESLTEQVLEQIEILQEKVDEYLNLIEDADQNSDRMAETIARTKERAGKMNTSVGNLLERLAQWREESLDLLDAQNNILTSADDEQAALLAVNDEFQSLLAESQGLADQAKGNLSSADTVYDTFEAIDEQARSIQDSGADLVKEADNLAANLTDKLEGDQNFADNFSEVLANSRIGERPNEQLYRFLSNPVQGKNDGVIAAGDTLTPYFLVLISFIVSLFTAYGISTYDQRRLRTDTFAAEKGWIRRNAPITTIMAGIGMVEGLLIGALSGYLLHISQMQLVMWTALITLIVLAILFTASYLLRQLKMLGMFVLLTALSVYLFLTEALGFDFDKMSLAAKIRTYSPLQYVEKVLSGFAKGIAEHQLILAVLVAVMLVGLVANLFVFKRIEVKDEGAGDDDGVSEAH